MYVIALISNGNIAGYYISDDQELTTERSEARTYATLELAQNDVKLCDQQWILEAKEYFLPVGI